jgi:hypothetical protein
MTNRTGGGGAAHAAYGVIVVAVVRLGKSVREYPVVRLTPTRA